MGAQALEKPIKVSRWEERRTRARRKEAWIVRLIVLTSFVLTVVVGVRVGGGSFDHGIVGYLCLALAAVVAVGWIALFAFDVFIRRPSPMPSILPLPLLLFLALLVGTFASSWVAQRLNSWHWTRAWEYCEEVRTLLEEYKVDHGSYPASLDGLEVSRIKPKLIEEIDFYEGDESHYRLEFWAAAEGLSGVPYWYFDSTVGSWQADNL
jgi:hypothetical protein